MPPRIRALDRRTTLLVVAGCVLLLVALLAAVQARAAEAQQRRDVAAQEQAAAAEEERERTAQRAADAERVAAEAERAALEDRWSAAVAEVGGPLAEADAVLDGSHGRVPDDGVRTSLAEAIEVVRSVTAGPPAQTRLTEALLTMTSAVGAVSDATTQWQAEQDALAAQAAAQADPAGTGDGAPAQPAVGGPPSTGAGPDCGGPQSYEPPKDDGSPTFYTSTPTESGDGSNGRVPASSMSRLGWCTDSQGNGQWLRSDAAAALARLNEAFRGEFGENIAVDMSYRSYEDQVAMREHYGSLAARPGTSNHGLGLAFDTWEWRAYGFGSPRYEWIVANGPAYGWVAPSWARQGGSNPEYWHYEYAG